MVRPGLFLLCCLALIGDYAPGMGPKGGVVDAPAPAIATEQTLAAMGLRDAVVVSLAVGRRTAIAAPVSVAVPIRGKFYALELTPETVRADSYQVLVQLSDGSYKSIEPTPPNTFRGVLANTPGSAVAASILDDGLHASIVMPDGSNYWVEPLGDRLAGSTPDQHVVYRHDDVISNGGACIALSGPVGATAEQSVAGGVAGTDLFIAELAIDADFGYYSLFRNEPDPQAALEATVNSIINAVNLQYESEVGIRHVLTTLIIRTTIDDPYSGLDPVALLNQFRNEWDTNQSAVPRDLAQLFTSRDLTGSTIGIAWIGQVCRTTYAYSLIQPTCCSSFAEQTDLSAHELGHNWGADHCGDEDGVEDCLPACPGYTMNCFITAANRFHETLTQPEIIDHRDTRTCLVQGDVLRRVIVEADRDAIFEGESLALTAIADFRYSNDLDVTNEVDWALDRFEAGAIGSDGVFQSINVNADTCVTVTAPYTYDGVTLTGVKTIVVLDTDAPLAIILSDPPDGAIDARQPSKPDGSAPVGWESIDLVFNGETCLMTKDDFAILAEGGLRNVAVIVDLVRIGLRSVRLYLEEIEPGTWTTITHVDSGDSVQIGSLPGDVDGDGTTDSADILELIRNLNGQLDPPLELWQCDVDRTGRCTPADLLRAIDLLNGADAYDPWNGVFLP